MSAPSVSLLRVELAQRLKRCQVDLTTLREDQLARLIDGTDPLALLAEEKAALSEIDNLVGAKCLVERAITAHAAVVRAAVERVQDIDRQRARQSGLDHLPRLGALPT